MRLRTIAAVAAACGLLGLAGAGSAQDKGGAKPAGKPALTVTTITPQRIDMALNVQATGSLAAWQEAIIGAESGGLRVAEVRANVGDTVTRGQVLAVFAPETVEADLAQARAGLAEAEATLADARANAARAKEVETSGALSQQQVAQLVGIRWALAIDLLNHEHVGLHTIPTAIATSHIRRRDHHLPDIAAHQVVAQQPIQFADDILMHFSRAGSHEQHPVDDLIALPVVGQRIERVDSPFLSDGGHTHRLFHSAQGRQAGIAQNTGDTFRARHQKCASGATLRQRHRVDATANQTGRTRGGREELMRRVPRP